MLIEQIIVAALYLQIGPKVNHVNMSIAQSDSLDN